MDDAKASYLELLTEEYRGLREEVRQASAHCYTAIQWGSAAIALLAAAAASQWRKHDAVVVLVFLLVVPFFVSMTMFFWLGELARIRRAANFLSVIEEKAALVVEESMDDFKELGTRWEERFSRVVADLGLTLNTTVRVDALSWERWLNRERMAAGGVGSGNLSWVFRIRFALFPIVGLSSLVIGSYYVFWGGQRAHHVVATSLAFSVGFLIVAFSTWAGIEFAIDLDRTSRSLPKRVAYPWPRQILRRLLARALAIHEWNEARAKLPANP